MHDLRDETGAVGAPEDGAAPVSPGSVVHRAGTLQAIGGMTAIAVAVAAGVVLVMRFAPPPAAESPRVAGFEETVPVELDGGFEPGEVPAQISAAFDVPVVAVRVLDELPAGVDGCDGMFGPADAKDVEQVVATPDGLMVSMIGPEPSGGGWDLAPGERPAAEPMPVPLDELPLWRESCTLTEAQGRWIGQGSSGGPVEDFGMDEMGMGYSCCDADGLAMASAYLSSPDGATWALQERGAYWLAYPVIEGVRLPLSWRFDDNGFGPRVSSTHVVWVDDEGLVLDDRYIDP